MMKKRVAWAILICCLTGCTRLFGWDVQAPGILSESFFQQITPGSERVALYFKPDLVKFESTDRGGRLADPQNYHVGEAFAPMLLEGFQNAFSELIFLEVEPTSEVLKRYGISYLVCVDIKRLANRVTMKGQALTLGTETVVFDSDLKMLARFESQGTSDAKAVFRKKGGPQVNLNAALERNVLAILHSVRDSIHVQVGK